ncbi:MAG: Phosphate transport system permease protein PstA [uncultured Solirubrobacterales bacterium]|uniref:Phosphate transport system permease protein PstA n=1 Tax=uncultured Solirubrobacterales bacterium TaxID=768556 RepID=A0A6J4TCE9_9ACTN|nr:MAG: Phosphate transport system permease protein PstA [uncultured Solirubrobacterales bacterium]
MSVAEAPVARAVVRGASSGARVREILFPAALLMCIAFAMLALVVLLVDVAVDGIPVLSADFLTRFPSQIFPERSGIQSALVGTLLLMAVCAVFIVPVGTATAIYLEEYADNNRWWNRLIEVNIQNLAAVPSIVYGILGLAFLVRGPLELGRVVLAGALTLGLLVLPVVIIVGREAIRAVPSSIREGSMALGATQWQTIWKQILPGALPGIATGVILALSRAIGETAPLIVVGAAAFARFNPNDLTNDPFSALPIQILAWVQDPQDEFRALAAGAILVLLFLLLLMNAGAIYLRNRFEQKW